MTVVIVALLFYRSIDCADLAYVLGDDFKWCVCRRPSSDVGRSHVRHSSPTFSVVDIRRTLLTIRSFGMLLAQAIPILPP